eukprot:4261153-Amphidinium_carterae.1
MDTYIPLENLLVNQTAPMVGFNHTDIGRVEFVRSIIDIRLRMEDQGWILCASRSQDLTLAVRNCRRQDMLAENSGRDEPQLSNWFCIFVLAKLFTLCAAFQVDLVGGEFNQLTYRLLNSLEPIIIPEHPPARTSGSDGWTHDPVRYS